ncbi:hypothetical protein ACFLZ5_08835 [Thermodesulfobacteriota bacterium]
MDKKYGAYVCTGCGIGDTLDIEALSTVASSEMSMECKTHQALCSADGRALIESDINDGVNTVVVAACSPRVMQSEFNFGDDKITIRANIREQVVWSKGKTLRFLVVSGAQYFPKLCPPSCGLEQRRRCRP